MKISVPGMIADITTNTLRPSVLFVPEDDRASEEVKIGLSREQIAAFAVGLPAKVTLTIETTAEVVTADQPKSAPTEKDLVEASRVTALAMLKAAAYCTEMVEKDPVRGAEWAQAAATLSGRAI